MVLLACPTVCFYNYEDKHEQNYKINLFWHSSEIIQYSLKLLQDLYENHDSQIVYNKMRSSLKLTSNSKIGKEEAKKIKIIINCLYESNDSMDFREPVDWKGMGLTDYLNIVSYPMDLSTVSKKFKEDKYTKVEEVLDDIQLIWDNCKTYNPDNSWIHSIAEKLQRSFKKMIKNYFPDMNISIPVKILQEQKTTGPMNLFQDEGEDITYHQKLKFSEELSFLSSEQLIKIIDEIIAKSPNAYKDVGQGKGQILVDSMDLIFFNEISLMVRNLINGGDQMQIQEQKPKPRGRGRPPANPK